MSREEDLISSTTHAIASSVREVPPLRLDPAPHEAWTAARAPRRLRGGSGGSEGGTGSGGLRRWRSWTTPLAAAGVVVALAVALVIIKDIPNGGEVPVNNATSTSAASTAGPGGPPAIT